MIGFLTGNDSAPVEPFATFCCSFSDFYMLSKVLRPCSITLKLIRQVETVERAPSFLPYQKEDDMTSPWMPKWTTAVFSITTANYSF